MRGFVTEECLPFKGTFDAKCSEMCAEPMQVKPESFCALFWYNYIKEKLWKMNLLFLI